MSLNTLKLMFISLRVLSMMRYRLGTKTGLMTSVSRCVPKSADQAQSVPSDNT